MWADFPKNRHCKHAIYRGEGGSVEGITEADVLVIAISQGGTGATSAEEARTNLGLGTAATTAASAYATAAQGALADSAVQPADIGTAAAEDVGYFATAAQGTLADSAVQPGDLATVATTGSYNDLTDKPTAGSGTVTSVAMTVPTGLSISGSPITTTGTLAVTYTSGYAIPTTSKQTNWDTAYGWGNHASAGYLTSYTETDPVYVASSWYTTTNNASNWDTAYGWGNHASAGYLTSETYTGTVTSVAMTVPTGLSVSGTPVTSSGTLAVTLAAGYSIPTTANQTNWSTAYGWGNHASAGYLTTETYTGTVTSVGLTVPTGLSVSGSPVTSSGTLAVTLTAGYSIPTTTSQGNWDTAYGWGNHASAGYLTSSSTLDASKLSGTIDGGTY